jgi:hypothetical protein
MAKDSDSESLGQGKVIKATDKALQVELTDLGETRWIPRSVIHDDSEVYDEGENKEGEVVVKQWWANQEGLV